MDFTKNIYLRFRTSFSNHFIWSFPSVLILHRQIAIYVHVSWFESFSTFYRDLFNFTPKVFWTIYISAKDFQNELA